MKSAVSYPQYEGTKRATLSQADKNRLFIARQKRLRAKILARPTVDHNELPTPEGDLDPGDFTGKDLLADNVNDLRRPFGVYAFLKVHCVCVGCRENRESESKRDVAWANGDCSKSSASRPAALCSMELPLHSNRLSLRSVRSRVAKDADWVSSLQEKMTGIDFNDVFNELETTTSTPTNMLEKMNSADKKDFMDIEQMIQLTNREIRKLTGSADWTAEVVLIHTSLMVSRKSYFQSWRFRRFLEAKGVEHFAVDINSDIGNSLDAKLLNTWREENRLINDSEKKGKMVVMAPQLLIDGIPILSYEDLMVMEDEGDLDHILAREACPNCLKNRSISAGMCKKCGAVFMDLLSTKHASPQEIKILLQRSEMSASRVKAPTPHDWEKRRRQLGLRRLSEDISIWFDAEQIAKFSEPSVGFSVEFQD